MREHWAIWQTVFKSWMYFLKTKPQPLHGNHELIKKKWENNHVFMTKIHNLLTPQSNTRFQAAHEAEQNPECRVGYTPKQSFSGNGWWVISPWYTLPGDVSVSCLCSVCLQGVYGRSWSEFAVWTLGSVQWKAAPALSRGTGPAFSSSMVHREKQKSF